LRSTARFRSRRGTDMRSTGKPPPSSGCRCKPKYRPEATGRDLNRTDAFTRTG
jgi:hypothetical protein